MRISPVAIDGMLRILIVEDDTKLRQAYARLLGYEMNCYSAASYLEAESLLEELEDLDVLLTDFDLSDKRDGLDVCDLVRGRFPDIPVLMVSGVDLREPRVQEFLSRRRVRFCDKLTFCGDMVSRIHGLVYGGRDVDILRVTNEYASNQQSQKAESMVVSSAISNV